MCTAGRPARGVAVGAVPLVGYCDVMIAILRAGCQPKVNQTNRCRVGVAS